ncbi:MAG: putative molybdenum carrier protein [Gammaproteobacteria bacterium]
MKGMIPHSRSAISVISGGQTGVDRAALDAAMAMNIPVGGWCPKGRRAEDGRIPERYPLRETASEDYALRTRLNVLDADATLILCRGSLAGGTLLTKQLADGHDKKLRIADPGCAEDHRAVAAWLIENGIGTLNVAGPREEKVPGIYLECYRWLRRLFEIWISDLR